MRKQSSKTGICDSKTQFMLANLSSTNRVIPILIHSAKSRFQNIFVTLLHRVAKDVSLSSISWHKRYDFQV